MALARRCPGSTINLFRMVIDERLHAHSAYIKHVAARHTEGATTRLGGATAADTWRNVWRLGEVKLRGAGTVRRRHGALTGKAAESVEGWWARRGIAALTAVV